MSLTMAALGVAGSAAGGALSGAGGGLLNKKKKASVPTYTPHERRLTQASQALIPQYLKSLRGAQTPFTQMLTQQLRSQGAQQAQQNVQGFMRQIGTRGGADFGPGAYQQLGQIYQSFNPALMQALSQARFQQLQQAQQGLQRWSEIKPGTMTQPKQAGPGASAAAGALQGLGRGLGSLSGMALNKVGQSAGAPPQITPATEQLGPISPQTAMQQTIPAQRQQLSRMAGQATGFGQWFPGGGIPGF